MTLEQVQELLSNALQSDLENGVQWLNARATREFVQNYPALNEAIRQIMEAE